MKVILNAARFIDMMHAVDIDAASNPVIAKLGW